MSNRDDLLSYARTLSARATTAALLGKDEEAARLARLADCYRNAAELFSN